MATRARSEFTLEELKNTESLLFPGAKAGCIINGRLENNNLYGSLKTQLNGAVLQDYLMEKYHWTEHTFNRVDWKAHYTVITKFPRPQQITLVKYIHGWLATTKRRHREQQSSTNRCTLCGLEDGCMHIF